eukprot:2181211-Prymnesium_polylepis.1
MMMRNMRRAFGTWASQQTTRDPPARAHWHEVKSRHEPDEKVQMPASPVPVADGAYGALEGGVRVGAVTVISRARTRQNANPMTGRGER